MSRSDDIRREIEASRAAIARDYHGVRAEFDIPAKIKRTVISNPLPWLGGAAILGFWIARPRRAPKVKVKKVKGSQSEVIIPEAAKHLTLLGGIFAVAKMLFPLLRPLLSAYAAKRISELAANLGK